MGNNFYFIKHEWKPDLYSTHFNMQKEIVVTPSKARGASQNGEWKEEKENSKKSGEVIFWAGHCSPGLKGIIITSSREQDQASYRCSISKHWGRGPPMTSQHPAESLDASGLKGRGGYCFHFSSSQISPSSSIGEVWAHG